MNYLNRLYFGLAFLMLFLKLNGPKYNCKKLSSALFNINSVIKMTLRLQ